MDNLGYADYLKVGEYAYFLNWELSLGMFVPAVDLEPIIKPIERYVSSGLSLGYQCPYCGYMSSSSLLSMEHGCVIDEYNERELTLVYKGFCLALEDSEWGSYVSDGNVVVCNNEGVALLFTVTGEIYDITNLVSRRVGLIKDLGKHKLELVYGW
jgi:hypothetical protein